MFNLKRLMAVLLIACTASIFCYAQNNAAETKAESETSVQENNENLSDAQKAQNEIVFQDSESDDASVLQNSGTSGVFVFLRKGKKGNKNKKNRT